MVEQIFSPKKLPTRHIVFSKDFIKLYNFTPHPSRCDTFPSRGRLNTVILSESEESLKCLVGCLSSRVLKVLG